MNNKVKKDYIYVSYTVDSHDQGIRLSSNVNFHFVPKGLF